MTALTVLSMYHSLPDNCFFFYSIDNPLSLFSRYSILVQTQVSTDGGNGIPTTTTLLANLSVKSIPSDIFPLQTQNNIAPLESS